MKKKSSVIALILVIIMVLATALASCGGGKDGEGEDKEAEKDPNAFDYSSAYDEDGYFTGVTAADYVTLPDYSKIEIERSEIDGQIDAILAQYPDKIEVKDREVKDEDTVNIDYVGYVDGEPFEGGDTKKKGTEVTIGVIAYIDGFLDQLIGHKPGDEFDVNVTFPKDYGEEKLSGKDAVFKTKINFIVEKKTPELTDKLVKERIKPDRGWNSIKDMEDSIIGGLAIGKLFPEATVAGEIPESVVQYQIGVLLDYNKQMASYYGIKMDELYASVYGVDSEEAYIEKYKDDCKSKAGYYLFLQAVAEKEKIEVGKKDVKKYLDEVYNAKDKLNDFAERFGMPYLKAVTIYDKVSRIFTENTVVK